MQALISARYDIACSSDIPRNKDMYGGLLQCIFKPFFLSDKR